IEGSVLTPQFRSPGWDEPPLAKDRLETLARLRLGRERGHWIQAAWRSRRRLSDSQERNQLESAVRRITPWGDIRWESSLPLKGDAVAQQSISWRFEPFEVSVRRHGEHGISVRAYIREGERLIAAGFDESGQIMRLETRRPAGDRWRFHGIFKARSGRGRAWGYVALEGDVSADGRIQLAWGRYDQGRLDVGWSWRPEVSVAYWHTYR